MGDPTGASKRPASTRRPPRASSTPPHQRREWRPACVRRVPWPRRRSPTARAELAIGSRPILAVMARAGIPFRLRATLPPASLVHMQIEPLQAAGRRHARTSIPSQPRQIWCQQRASRCWLIGRAEHGTYCKIVIIWRLTALDLVARNIWTPRRNFAV